MAVAVEGAAEVARADTRRLGDGDVGHQLRMDIFLSFGFYHHLAEGIPVLRRTNLEVGGNLDGYDRLAALHVERNLIIYARAV